MTRLSAPAEDCLLLAHRMSERNELISVSGLARGLRVTDPTITSMVQKLAKAKLLHHTPRKDISLTKQGGLLAQKLIRRHRLIETFLHRRLGYSWDEVHEEAEKIEHAVSDKFVAAIDREMNFPKFDPHGDPIPSVSGDIRSRDLTPLSKIQKGKTGTLARVLEGKPELLAYLTKLGIKLGSKIKVVDIPAFDNVIELNIEGRQVTVGMQIAEQILVES